LAQQRRLSDTQSQMLWQHLNPVTGDGLSTDSQGLAIYRTTIDPMATDVGDSDPFADYSGGGGDTGEGMSQSAIDSLVASLVPGWGGPRCAIDGMVTGCRLAFGALSSGAAELGPSQTTVGVYSRSLQRYIGLATWNPTQAAAGVSVFGLPAGWSINGMNFTGNGFTFSNAFPMADMMRIYGNLGSQYQGLGNWMGQIVHSGFGTLGQIAEAAYPFGHAPQKPTGFNYGNNGSFSDAEKQRLQRVWDKLQSEDCQDWFDRKLAEFGDPGNGTISRTLSLDAAMQAVTINKYNVNLTAAQMGISQADRDEIAANYDNRWTGVANAVTNGGRTWLMPEAFQNNSSIEWTNRDLAGIIVHELFHVAGYGKAWESRIKGLSKEIQQHCSHSHGLI